jgi:serine protease Do
MSLDPRLRAAPTSALVFLIGLLLMLVAQPTRAVDGVVLPDFTRLVASQGAAVVNISATQAAAQPQKQPFRLPELDESDPMFEFFRKFIPRMPEYPGAEPDDKSLGSGFIISADGYILTNAHVVEAAESIVVRLADKREFDATVIGADARSDVALIRIEAKALPHVVLGDPEALAVGEWVLAIGSPFGFEQSVTAGIVSAKGRSLPDENFVPFIQTDVAINPGNSGGPLFNLRGEVVGINSQIYSRTGGFMGLSFAIPIDVAMDVQQQLREKGRVERGRIGVSIQEVTRDLADSFGLPRPAGALVSSVEAGGPAALGGIVQGDVIVRFNERSIESSADLPRIVAAARPGSKVEVTIYRDGAPRALSVTLGEWRDPEEEVEPETLGSAAGATNRLGLELAAPTAQQRRERSITHGLLVQRAEGPAARAEIVAGDLVLAIVTAGRQLALDRVEDFERAVAALQPGQQVTVLVGRGEASSYVSLRAEK